MTATNTSPFSSNNSPARQGMDVLAYAVHNLGYWPSDSVVMVLCGREHLGPTLRINREDLATADIKNLLKHLLELSPQTLEAGEKVEKFFLIIFGPGGEVRQRHLSPQLQESPSLLAIEEDAQDSRLCQRWIEASHSRSLETGLLLADFFYVGSVSRWELSPEENALKFSGFLTDVLKSPVYLDLVLKGSTVSENSRQAHQLRLPDAQGTRNPARQQEWIEQAGYWFDHYLFTVESPENGYCACYLDQKFAENCLWAAVVEDVLQGRRRRFSDRDRPYASAIQADLLREQVSGHLAGYLLGTLTSVTSAQFILYTICSSPAALSNLFLALHLADSTHPRGNSVSSEEENCLAPLILPGQGGSVLVDHALAQLMKGEDLHLFLNTQQASPPQADSEHFAEVIMGNSLLAPNWIKISALEQVIAQLLEISDAERTAYLIIIQAWVSWFKGLSTQASQLLDDARKTFDLPPTPLDLLLENSLLPQWVLNESQCFRPDQ